MKKYFFPLAVLCMGMFPGIYAQPIEDLFAARDDASTYTQYYLSPMVNGLMYGMNDAWYHNAETHELWGINVDISLSASIIPDDEKSFTFVNSQYNFLSHSGGNVPLPTIAGGNTSTTLTLDYQGNTAQIDALDGLEDEWPVQLPVSMFFPTPMVQVGVGVPLNTDVVARFFPNVENEGWKFGLFGLGVKHSLSQYFPRNEEDDEADSGNHLNLSALAAFTRMRFTYIPQDTGIPGDGQEIVLDVNSFNFQLIAGYDFSIINLYAAAGYSGGVSSLSALGSYEFDLDHDGNTSQDEIVYDPLDMRFEASGVRFTTGFSLNLGPASLYASYTLQKYQTFTAGLALDFN